MSDSALEASGVTKRYRESRGLALDGIDLRVRRGSITALVGPNGAGKSTLIKAWVAFERPTQGSVRVEGTDPWRDRARALGLIGYVPQTPALYREFTAREHLAFAVTQRRGFDELGAKALMDLLGIPLDSRTDRLSGGQRSRLSIALAMGTRAPVLLLDEPLASLDPLARRELLQVLTEHVRSSGATVLLSSHVVSDVAQACDALVILTGGKKLIDEPISLVVDRHRVVQGDPGLHGTVASFIDGRGDTLSLIATADRTIGSSATLEDVVLGYLAAGQDRWPSAGQPTKTGTDRPATSVVPSADARSGVRTAEVLEALARGETQREILDRYPDLSAADIQAALRSAAEAARSREASRKS